MTVFSLGARLHLSVSSNRALSLPQSRLCILWARQLPPQREARALPRRAPKLATSERKIVTKETHQGCLSFLFKSPLPCKGEARALPRRAQSLPKCKPQLSPPQAGCPHPSRCGAAPRRATFPKGKAKQLPPQTAELASENTGEPRFAPYISRRSPKQTTKNPAEPGFCFNIRCGYSFSPDRPRRFRGSDCSYPCLFRTWFLPPYRS